MCKHAYDELNLAGRAKLVVKSVGSGTGSKYKVSSREMCNDSFITSPNLMICLFCFASKVCGKDDANLGNLIEDFSEQKVSNIKYHFYDIANPKEYLNGDDAVAVEKGPYSLKYVLI